MAELYPQNFRKQDTLNLSEVIIEELETQDKIKIPRNRQPDLKMNHSTCINEKLSE